MSKSLPAAPSLEHLKTQAKNLLKAIQQHDPATLTLLEFYLPHLAVSGEADKLPAAIHLSHAQWLVAREYGFPSWPQLKAHVETLSGQEIPFRQQALDEAMIRAAIKQKDVARVQELLDAGANINGRLAEVGTTALGWSACGEEDMAMMEFLLAHGADIDMPANGDSTALWCAAFKGSIKSVQLLLKHGADVNHPQPGNYTILHGGTYSGNSEVVRLLLEADAEVNAHTTDSHFGAYWFYLPYCGETPLHNAMAYGDQQMIQMLLNAGADTSAKTRHDETPFHWAARQQHRTKQFMRWLRELPT